MPRMTNTFMLAGESDPEEIIRSVPKGLYCANFGGGQVDITSGNFVFSASESYLIEDGQTHDAGARRDADRQRSGSVEVRHHGRQRSEARRRHRRLRQRRAERTGRRRNSDDQARPDDGGRNGLNLEDLASRSHRACARRAARRRAECTISEGEQFSANVRMGEIESLKEAGSRGAGVRVLVGKHTGSAYTSDLSREGIRQMVDSALELAKITTEDPLCRACRTRPSWARSTRDLGLYSDSVAGTACRTQDRVGEAGRGGRARRRPAHRQLRRRVVRYPRRATVFANSLGFLGSYRTSSCSHIAVPVAKQNGIDGARLLVQRRAKRGWAGESRKRSAAAPRSARCAAWAPGRWRRRKRRWSSNPAWREPARQHLRCGQRRLGLSRRDVPRRQAGREGCHAKN